MQVSETPTETFRKICVEPHRATVEATQDFAPSFGLLQFIEINGRSPFGKGVWQIGGIGFKVIVLKTVWFVSLHLAFTLQLQYSISIRNALANLKGMISMSIIDPHCEN
jgi:hypothetical protein